MYHLALAVALAASAGPLLIRGGDSVPDDPYKRRSRSKGEKARNRKHRK